MAGVDERLVDYGSEVGWRVALGALGGVSCLSTSVTSCFMTSLPEASVVVGLEAHSRHS